MIQVKRLFDIPYYQLKNHPSKNMFVTKVSGNWIGISTEDFIDEVNRVSRGLVAYGVQEGDNVAMASNNRYEWNILDIAIQQTGAVVVPLYPNISEADYKYILNNAGIKLCVVGNDELFGKIKNIENEVETLQYLFTFDQVKGAIHWTAIHERASEIDQSEIESRKEKVKGEDLVTIIYTSGTTGNPKGVMLSHNNILSNVDACQPAIPADSNSKVLSFLPVCHIYERMLHYLYMYIGCSIHFAESMDTIGDNIREVKPDVFTAVPRLIEKVYDRIIAKGDELTGIKRKLFFWAVTIAEEFELEGKGIFYKIKLAIARKLIFSKWQEALGGNVRAIASGSAALQPRLARIFMAAGIPILEGYGLTETSPVISVNQFEKGIKFGSVGPLIENVEVQIAEDGEILVKGPNVMLGYYKLPDATGEVIDSEGWFHTGDIGTFVDEKFLKITDRKKEIFKTSGGKYIVPQAMENKFKESRFIEQIIVIGENEKFPAALIVPGFAYAKEWAAKKGIDLGDGSNRSIAENAQIRERIQLDVNEFNKGFGNWEQIKKFELLDHEFSIDGGELTPTLKLKRKIILAKYQNEYKRIFSE
ncbi:MAG: AMP-dependent synthetase/ligase [Flavobacteriia bacterium]